MATSTEISSKTAPETLIDHNLVDTPMDAGVLFERKPAKTADGPTGLRLRADKASDVPTGTLAQMTRCLMRMAVETYVATDLSGLQRDSWRMRTKSSSKTLARNP